MATPNEHAYEIHAQDGSIHKVTTTKGHDHHDFKGDVVEWFNKHGKNLLKTAIVVIAIKKGNVTLWKK